MNVLKPRMEMAMEALGRSQTLINRGEVNRVNMEEVEAQPDAVIGKFLVKSFTALVLLILVHRIHTYQRDLWISINCQPKPLDHLSVSKLADLG